MANVKYVVTLTGDEREDLLAVVDRGRAPATQTRHTNILLAVDWGEHAGPGMTDAQAAARARIPPLRDSGPVAGRVGRTSNGVRLSAARYTGSGVERTPGDDAHSGRSREHRPNLRPEAGDAGSAGGVGAGGSDAPSLLASSLDRPAGRRGDPLAGETREGSDHAGLHGNTRAAGGGGDLTRIVPGDVSAHTPAKARRRLATVPGRLGFVFAPRHGSWPNLVEGLFSRTAHQMQRSDPGLERGRARREGSAPPQGRRAPSRSSAGGGETCWTQARRPRDPSWTPSFRMEQTGQVSC